MTLMQKEIKKSEFARKNDSKHFIVKICELNHHTLCKGLSGYELWVYHV